MMMMDLKALRIFLYIFQEKKNRYMYLTMNVNLRGCTNNPLRSTTKLTKLFGKRILTEAT